MGLHFQCNRISFSSTRNILTVLAACSIIGFYTCVEGICSNTAPCLNGGTCFQHMASPTNYTCQCSPGYMDQNCSTVCPQGKYGADCRETCSNVCVEGATCSHVNGECLCIPAFYGAVCDKNDMESTANLTSPVNGMISEDGSFTLTCWVNLGQTEVNDVNWYKEEDVEITPKNNKYEIQDIPSQGGSTLTVLSAGYEDSGAYYCQAYTEVMQNLLKTGRSGNVIVNVFVPGQTDRSSSILEDRVQLGDTAGLRCVFISSLDLTISWERNGQILTDSDSRTVLTTVSYPIPGAKRFTSNMSLHDITSDDHGYYRCMASANISLDGVIIVIEVPELGNPMFRNVRSNQLTIAWDITDDGNDANISCTPGLRPLPNQDPVFSVVNNNDVSSRDIVVSPYTTYRINVVCRNSAGDSLPLEFEDQTTLVSFPSKVERFETERVGFREVHIDWDPPSTPNGPIDGYILYIIDDNSNTKNVTTSGIYTFHELTELSPYTSYTIDIRAFNNKEDGTGMLISDNPVTIEFFTAEDAPQNPMTIDEGQECRVMWEPPRSPNGIILMYTLYTQITTHNDHDDILERLVFTTLNTGWNISKAGYPPDRLFRFSVSATTSAGEGSNATSSNFSCYQPVGVPDKPPMPLAPSADDITTNSFTTMLPEYINTNGPISCFEIIVVQVSDHQADINDTTTLDIVGYDEAYNRPNIFYRAFVFSELPSMITVGGSARQNTNCDTGAAMLNAVNGPLLSGGRYTCFIRVYSPTGVENRPPLYENGNFMPITQLSDEVMPSTSASPGTGTESSFSSMDIIPIAAGAGAGGAVLLICAIIVVVVCYKHKSRERSPLDVDRVDYNDKDGEQYVNSAFIPNSYEEMGEKAQPSRPKSLGAGADHPYDPVRITPPLSRKDPTRPASETNVKPTAVTPKPKTNPQPFKLPQVILKPTPQQSSDMRKQLIPEPTAMTTSKTLAVTPKPNVSSKPQTTPKPVATPVLKAAAKPDKPFAAVKPHSDVISRSVLGNKDQRKDDAKPVSNLKTVRRSEDGQIYENEEVGQKAPQSRGQSWGAGVSLDDRVYDPVRISPIQTRKEPTKPPAVTPKPRVTSRP